MQINKLMRATAGFALSALVCTMLAGCDETARRTTPPARPGTANSAAHVVAQPVADTKNVALELKRWNVSLPGSR